MRPDLLEVLRCPRSGQALHVDEARESEGAIESGWLVSADGLHRYEIRKGVPRFVPESNYADNFGMQWNKFSKTQLDSYSGHPISADRFWKATGWTEQQLAGKWVLDVGCGAGRFAEIAAKSGARVVALDYSSAVDACSANLRQHPNVHVVQGDVYELPLLRRGFAFVYSLGVLQHTPDVARAFAALPPMVADEGRLCVDFYEKSWKSRMLPKYWLRPITKRIAKPRLFSFLERAVPVMLPVSKALGAVPVIGSQLRRIVPVANYTDELPLNRQQQLEWSLLDTFDWLAPEFDNPQTPEIVRAWLTAAGMRDIDVLKAGHLVGRAVQPRGAVSH